MKLEKFVMMCISRGYRFSDDINGVNFTQRKKLAALTEHVVFHCDFDSKGRCLSYRNYPEGEPCMCCCNSCHYNIGHMHGFPTGNSYSKIKNKELKVYARHFSEEHIMIDGGKRRLGYWRPEKGCVLPRAYRSNTCLTYDCRGKDEERPEWERLLFKLLADRRLKYPVTVRGEKCSEYNIADTMLEWWEDIKKDDKNNSK